MSSKYNTFKDNKSITLTIYSESDIVENSCYGAWLTWAQWLQHELARLQAKGDTTARIRRGPRTIWLTRAPETQYEKDAKA